MDENGHPFKINNKEQYIFIRAKGVKYGNLANYLYDLAKRDDLEPIVTPVTEQSKNFEKAQVNNKRFITKISVGKQSTNYGLKDVFEFSVGQKLGVEAVKSVLNKAKETIEKFRDKFDWSKGKSGSADYSGTKPVEESQKFEFSQETKQNAPGTTEIKEQKAEEKEFNFEDVSF